VTLRARITCLGVATVAFALAQSAGVVVAQNQNLPRQEASRTGQTFKVAGTVVSAATGAVLPQARISLLDTKSRENAISMVTSENGHFEFSNLKPGKYSLQGAKRGFITSDYEQHEQFSTAIVTGPEFSTENLVLRLTPMALITGHVLDEFGEPVRSANVVLYFESHAGGMIRVGQVSSSSSDDLGFFDFSPLRPGKYYVSATAKPWYAMHPATSSAKSENSPPEISPDLDVAYPRTFYGGATEADAATPLEVKGGDRLEIDMRLTPMPALHLTFRIPQDKQNNFTMPMLQKHVFDTEEFVQSDGFRSVEPGVFELTGVPPGRYSVRTKNSDSGQFEQAAEVDLSRDGQDLSDAHGEALGTLKLSLKMPGREALPRQYGVALQNSRHRTMAFKPGDPTGQFTFEDLLPGKYTILVGSQSRPYFVTRTSSQAGESSGHDVNITAGAAFEATAYLSGGTVSIEGIVKKKDKPVAGIMVALVPNDPVAHIELFRRDQSDFDGTFVLPAVVPGNYTIVAVEDAWGLEWLQPAILARYVQQGRNVAIDELMQGTVHLPDPVQVQPH
jgi:Carboxypeptidase regulatory-like domain